MREIIDPPKNFMTQETAQRVGEIKDELWEIFSALSGKYRQDSQPCTDGDVSDFLANLKMEIEAKTDGRPKFLDFSAGYRVPTEDRAQYSADMLKENEEDCEEYSRFGECFERSHYKEKACLGTAPKKIILTMNDLKKVHAWTAAIPGQN
jgi:hypothetical protein